MHDVKKIHELRRAYFPIHLGKVDKILEGFSNSFSKINGLPAAMQIYYLKAFIKINVVDKFQELQHLRRIEIVHHKSGIMVRLDLAVIIP